ncbi:MAG: hypothetical protein ACNY01_04105, partial [Desulfobacteria bacterium]
ISPKSEREICQVILERALSLYNYQDVCQGNERLSLPGNLVKIWLKQGMKAKGGCSNRIEKR